MEWMSKYHQEFRRVVVRGGTESVAAQFGSGRRLRGYGSDVIYKASAEVIQQDGTSVIVGPLVRSTRNEVETALLRLMRLKLRLGA